MKIIEKLKNAPKLSRTAKRNLLLSLSLVIICAAVYLNWRLANGDTEIDGVVPADAEANGETESGSKILGESVEVSKKEDDYFAVSVIDRERVRDTAIETLREVVENEETSAETKQEALAKMTKLADAMTGEVNIENLVMAKGFENCVAVINDGSVDVIVKTVGLLPSDIAQIRDIVISETNVPVENIRIIEHV